MSGTHDSDLLTRCGRWGIAIAITGGATLALAFAATHDDRTPNLLMLGYIRVLCAVAIVSGLFMWLVSLVRQQLRADMMAVVLVGAGLDQRAASQQQPRQPRQRRQRRPPRGSGFIKPAEGAADFAQGYIAGVRERWQKEDGGAPPKPNAPL